jgi:hypothetical protein
MQAMDKTPRTFLTFAPIVTRDEAGVPKRFSGIAYSGGVIPQYGWLGDAAIDLATFTLPDGAIFALVDHDPTQRAGKLTARLHNNQILVDGEFFTATEAGREVAGLFAEGAPWQMSVGVQAKISQTETPVAQQINGQTLTVHALLTHATLREVSFVPVGADPNTTVAAFAAGGMDQAAQHRTPSKGNPPMTLEELQAKIAELEGSLTAEKTRADAAETTLATIQLAARKTAITQLAANLGRDLSPEETAAFEQMPGEIFAVMAGTLQSVKPTAPPAYLFSEQATQGKAPASQNEDLSAAIVAQVNAKQLAMMPATK